MFFQNHLYPNFAIILEEIVNKNPLQKKRIIEFLQGEDRKYFEFAEQLSTVINTQFFSTDGKRQNVIKAYSDTCIEILREQIRFKKTGKYSAIDIADIIDNVYEDKNKMRSYIIGLLLSYLFWPNHYKLFRFYQLCLADISAESYLEVGAGHGLFTSEVLKKFPDVNGVLIDISKTSLEISKEMLEAYKIDVNRLDFINEDFLNIPEDGNRYDFIVMGEVLEHVVNPTEFLQKAYNMLQRGGWIFLSTCANCPAIDHIYHFHSINEIRNQLEDAGLNIVRECAIPVENFPEDQWEDSAISVNYAALLCKK